MHEQGRKHKQRYKQILLLSFHKIQSRATGTRYFLRMFCVVCMYANVVGMVQINEGLEIGVQGKLCGWYSLNTQYRKDTMRSPGHLVDSAPTGRAFRRRRQLRSTPLTLAADSREPVTVVI